MAFGEEKIKGRFTCQWYLPILQYYELIVILSTVLAFFLSFGTICEAVTAYPSSFFVVQYDGSRIELSLQGDEHCHWLVDGNGYAVVKHNSTFLYALGRNEDGTMIPSKYEVGDMAPSNLQGLSMELRPDMTKLQRSRQEHLALRHQALQGHSIPDFLMADADRHVREGLQRRRLRGAVGTLKNLVIPILFSDHTDRDLPSQEELNMLWNQKGGHPLWAGYANASIRDFYLSQSYGQLDIISTVVDWVTISSSESTCADGSSGGTNMWIQCLRQALALVDDLIDFSEFDVDEDGYIDAIAFLHSGYGAEYGGYDSFGTYYTDRIWSHKWIIFNANTYSWQPFTSDEGVIVFEYHVEPALFGKTGSYITSIGVAAHETGHFLGLPDLYDTDYSSKGINRWGIMASSWGWSGNGGNPGSFCAWSKYVLGWVKPKEIKENGTHTIQDIQSNDDVYIISDPYPSQEYILIENRQVKEVDVEMPQGGLLIWHIDDSITTTNTIEGHPGQTNFPHNGKHYQVALLQADGEFDLEQNRNSDAHDIFHASGTSALESKVEIYPTTMAYQGGNVFSPQVSIFDISESGDEMTFSVSANFTIPDKSEKIEEPSILLQMFDSWGDGWSGNLFSLRYFDEQSTSLEMFTMLTGSYEEVYIAVENSTCYAFMVSSLGEWQSEISWNICGVSGIITDTAYFCINAAGFCSEYIMDCKYATLIQYDSWGDGWQGNIFSLYPLEDTSQSIQDVTMYKGFYGEVCLNVEASESYLFKLSTMGSWYLEISWEICGFAGTYDTPLVFHIDAEGSCFQGVCIKVYSAVEATETSGGTIFYNTNGFPVYFDYQQDSGAYIKWSLSDCLSGSYIIRFIYALKSGNRPLGVAVDGVVVEDQLPFPSTGSWRTAGQTADVTVSLSDSSTVALIATGSSGPNVVSMHIVGLDEAATLHPTSTPTPEPTTASPSVTPTPGPTTAGPSFSPLLNTSKSPAVLFPMPTEAVEATDSLTAAPTRFNEDYSEDYLSSTITNTNKLNNLVFLASLIIDITLL